MNNSITFIWILSLINLGMIGMAGLFTYESICEQEPRAPKFGAAVMAFYILLGLLILTWPSSRLPIAWFLGLGLAIQTIFLIPCSGHLSLY